MAAWIKATKNVATPRWRRLRSTGRKRGEIRARGPARRMPDSITNAKLPEMRMSSVSAVMLG